MNPDDSERRIVISPVGDAPPELLDIIGCGISRIFGFETTVTPFLENVEFAYDMNREQYHSTPILAKLETLAPPQALKIIAVTTADLFIPILTHVYGEAQLGGKAAIISTCRLNEGDIAADAEDTFRFRAVKEAVHELGHTFNLRHCKDRSCIMHYCRSIKDVDRKSDELCRYCGVLLNDEIRRMGAAASGVQKKPG